MQSFVYSVFVVVSSVIATLAMVGLGGIIILLITDGGSLALQDTRPRPTAALISSPSAHTALLPGRRTPPSCGHRRSHSAPRELVLQHSG